MVPHAFSPRSLGSASLAVALITPYAGILLMAAELIWGLPSEQIDQGRLLVLAFTGLSLLSPLSVALAVFQLRKAEYRRAILGLITGLVGSLVTAVLVLGQFGILLPI